MFRMQKASTGRGRRPHAATGHRSGGKKSPTPQVVHKGMTPNKRLPMLECMSMLQAAVITGIVQ